MLAAFFLTVLKDRTGRVCQTVSNVQDECVKLYQTFSFFRISAFPCSWLGSTLPIGEFQWVDFFQADPFQFQCLWSFSKQEQTLLLWNASDVSLGSSGTDKCIAVTLVSLYIQPFRFFKVTSSPSLDLDQSCQAGEQAKLNSIGGVFLGSSSIVQDQCFP